MRSQISGQGEGEEHGNDVIDRKTVPTTCGDFAHDAQMVNKNQVRCYACERVLTIRVTVAGGLQEFIFPCPYCGTPLTGTFYADQPTGNPVEGFEPKPFELKSEDFDYVEYDPALETPEMRVVAISTELPVHESMLAEPYDSSSFSAFLELINRPHSSAAMVRVVEKVNLFRQTRFEVLPAVRRAAVFYGRGEMDLLSRELGKFPGFADSALSNADPWTAVSVILEGFLAVLGAQDVSRAARGELAELLETAYAMDESVTRRLLNDLVDLMLQEHRRAVIDTLVRSLQQSDALVPGMWVEALSESALDEYRTQRADYDAVKTRFQEIFELGSRSLVLPASLANVVHREDVRQYNDGKRRSLREALKANAAIREVWLEDLPALKMLFDDRARATRNLIGHRLVSYDFKEAVLIDSDGNRHNYLRFLRDYLGAVRSCGLQLAVVAILTNVEQDRVPS